MLVNRFVFFAFAITFCTSAFAVDIPEYLKYRDQNSSITSTTLLSRSTPQTPYYSERSPSVLPKVSYLDSTKDSLHLTSTELSVLAKHQFVVSERLQYNCFGDAFFDVYKKDLPVYISTDAVLQALHMSYDKILSTLEKSIIISSLDSALNRMYDSIPKLAAQYQSNSAMRKSLEDIDLYTTVALSLLRRTVKAPKVNAQDSVTKIMDLINQQKLTSLPLFCSTNRLVDFSQFTVRGHYTSDSTLAAYFKSMMWLGRMDFLLTPTAYSPRLEKQDVVRMSIDAVLLNKLINISGAKPLLDRVDDMLTFMVGDEDNLTPNELNTIISKCNITDAASLLIDSTYNRFFTALYSDSTASQKILSDCLIMNPFSSIPDTLPISYRLMGQRFIIDSYVFSNVVYDKIIFNGGKVFRPMPDPLDAMYVLGNNDAISLLKDQIDKYHYGPQLASMRYLVDSYDDAFWNKSQYNSWLSAIRQLNPPKSSVAGAPYFMTTSAWHQEKLNTQCASWAQLRHDNILYAKQSYTPLATCSFPHSYIEPYPEFYHQIGVFASKALTYYREFVGQNNEMNSICLYYENLSRVMTTFETLARKELAKQPFNTTEREFLKQMLFIPPQMCGSGPYSGWYCDLFFKSSDARKSDFVVADVHTQPSDEDGNIVGNVLHVGTGAVNLGVFLAQPASSGAPLMAFVGPVFTYYEKVTSNFKRLTDKEWPDSIGARPDWVNGYIVNNADSVIRSDLMIPGVVFDGTAVVNKSRLAGPNKISVINRKGSTIINLSVAKKGYVTVRIIDQLGRAKFTEKKWCDQPGSVQLKVPTNTLGSGTSLIVIDNEKGTNVLRTTITR